MAWVPGTVSGAVSTECESTVEERIEIDVAAGHHSQTVTAVIDGSVIAIEGTLRVDVGWRDRQSSRSFPTVRPVSPCRSSEERCSTP